MTPWLAVAGAIVFEVLGTISLRAASAGRPRWYVAVVLGYVLAFGLLAVALDAGLPLGVVYGIWSACGVALTALAARFLFGEPLTRRMVAGIALIAVGVLVVEMGSRY